MLTSAFGLLSVTHNRPNSETYTVKMLSVAIVLRLIESENFDEPQKSGRF